jgi:hypothetical protein
LAIGETEAAGANSPLEGEMSDRTEGGEKGCDSNDPGPYNRPSLAAIPAAVRIHLAEPDD